MGKIITKRPKDEYVAEVDWGLLNQVAWVTLGFLIVAALATGITIHTVRWMVRKPPTVITKVVHQSALSGAQQEFINSCKYNDKVPDVHNHDWTCK